MLCVFVCFHSTLEGFYVDDALQGQGVYTYEEGGVLHGTYVDGELNGPAQEFDAEGRLVFKGQYKDNNRCGECWVYYSVSSHSACCSTTAVFRFKFYSAYSVGGHFPVMSNISPKL